MPTVSVIIPAFNASATIGRTLEALDRQDTGEPFEVIVVDDGSSDGTTEIAESAGGRVRVIRQDHQGPGPARNRGVQTATGRFLAFTDADCVPTPGWLDEGLVALADADLVQGAVYPAPTAARYPLERTVSVGAEVGLYETANLLVRRELFKRLGGFEDWLQAKIGKPLAEDVWFGWRARRAGARIKFSDAALVHHAVFRVSLHEYVGERIRLVYFPAMAARIPELRETLFYRRWFLSRRTALFDAAVAGSAAAALLTTPLPLVAVAPYTWTLARQAVPWRRHAPLVASANLLADAVGLVALVVGGVRSRTVLL
jgi:glycosyltransferase involved in cell wall biosynthesis